MYTSCVVKLIFRSIHQYCKFLLSSDMIPWMYNCNRDLLTQLLELLTYSEKYLSIKYSIKLGFYGNFNQYTRECDLDKMIKSHVTQLLK